MKALFFFRLFNVPLMLELKLMYFLYSLMAVFNCIKKKKVLNVLKKINDFTIQINKEKYNFFYEEFFFITILQMEPMYFSRVME